MEFDVVMLVVQLVIVYLLFALYRHAPCWIQKTVVAGMLVGNLFIAFAFVAAMFQFWAWWHIRSLGFMIEHLAVMLYVFRIVWQRGTDGGTTTQRTATTR